MGAVKHFYHDAIERAPRGDDEYPTMRDMASHCEWCGTKFRVTDARIELPHIGVVCSDDCAIQLRRADAGLPITRMSCHFRD